MEAFATQRVMSIEVINGIAFKSDVTIEFRFQLMPISISLVAAGL